MRVHDVWIWNNTLHRYALRHARFHPLSERHGTGDAHRHLGVYAHRAERAVMTTRRTNGGKHGYNEEDFHALFDTKYRQSLDGQPHRVCARPGAVLSESVDKPAFHRPIYVKFTDSVIRHKYSKHDEFDTAAALSIIPARKKKCFTKILRSTQP
jgi:hypothetical protein